MRRYQIELRVNDNQKKITAIKELRDATGMGLGDAKTFVEKREDYGNIPYQTLIVNEMQLGRLAALEGRDYVEGSPYFTFATTVKRLEDNSAIDISGNTLV
jgi:hypothetical protein